MGRGWEGPAGDRKAFDVLWRLERGRNVEEGVAEGEEGGESTFGDAWCEWEGVKG